MILEDGSSHPSTIYLPRWLAGSIGTAPPLAAQRGSGMRALVYTVRGQRGAGVAGDDLHDPLALVLTVKLNYGSNSEKGFFTLDSARTSWSQQRWQRRGAALPSSSGTSNNQNYQSWWY
jgi:hypothetical protein